MSLFGVISVGVLLLAVGEVASDDSDWAVCPAVCKCKWISGRKTADCMRQQLTQVPDSLSQEIQFIDLSENNIHTLPSEAFKSVGLVHLQKIYLKECSIQEIHKDAFKHLSLLIELDLTDNRIHTLHPLTFRENVRLRVLTMNKNKLTKLDDGLFKDMGFLQTVEMSDCQIFHIGLRTFNNVSNLLKLALDGNKLTHMRMGVVEKLSKLRSLVLHNNPWRCDCQLKPLRDWVVEHNLYSHPTSCKEPQNLEGKGWMEIESDAFACKPQITWPKVEGVINADSTDVTLSCRVAGSPPPEVHWVHNTRIISNDTRTKYGDLRYLIRSSSGENHRWFNLTITRVRPQDRGEFRCVAKSKGGVDERNITLVVEPSQGGIIGPGVYSDSWPLILGLIIGFIALLIIIVVLCCCFCRRREITPGKKSPVNGLSPNGDVSHHIGATSEQEKSLLTVNPVQKPPRRYEAQTPPNAGAEISELNRKLLDDGSSIAQSAVIDDERSIESIEATPHRSTDKLDDTYPPDLIAFPGRVLNASPAGSSASTAMEISGRLPLHPMSPLHSPLYNGFGTLPYSRSQSPFSPAVPIVLPRQGYVTIPRRPRVPSWSSAPTPSLLEDPLSPIKAEPVYDNLGPRTTADGSSVLSLNKAGLPDAPRRRASSSTPTPSNYSQFDDRESGILKPLPSPLSPDEKQYWRNRSTDSAGSLKRTGSSDIPVTTHTRPKVAPKPPPKPKGNGPLYEDEGEDGTEV
ncbi:hypothetical protein GE061_000685 [Apolygus lucorum]|uniref:Uncharacterized protein n=1 Tax=Apolygus lucorum TaxID=248454 RepID=A0A6A4K3Q9_APOLU|nr:hypothetical protein GE061_000685 [Apolygus lucorum]